MQYQGKKISNHPVTILTTLTLVFLTPIFLAWFFFKAHDTFGATTNHGSLIKKPFLITQIIPNATANGKWRLMLLNPGQCDKNCETWLYNIRQVRRATGKHRGRVERIILTFNSERKDPKLHSLLQHEYTGTQHLSTQQSLFTKIIKRNVHADYALKQGTIYVVDPHGNVMMTYRPDASPTDIYKDMERLLKVSQIG